MNASPEKPPPDAERPGPHARATSENVEQTSTDKAKGTAHNPAACATCQLVIPWTEARRAAAIDYSLRAGRRILDLEEVW